MCGVLQPLMLVSGVLFVVGAGIQAGAVNVAMLVIGRVVLGLGVGMASLVSFASTPTINLNASAVHAVANLHSNLSWDRPAYLLQHCSVPFHDPGSAARLTWQIFIACQLCFCAAGDILSLWNAYCVTVSSPC